MPDLISPWAGRWRVLATMPEGGGYDGFIEIAAAGDRLVLRWDISDGVYHGVGAPIGERLFVSCSPFDADIAIAVISQTAHVLVDRQPMHLAGIDAFPTTEGFGFGRVVVDDRGRESLVYAEAELRVAAWGRDIDRHVLLVYELAGADAASARWTLGRSPAVGTERLTRER